MNMAPIQTNPGQASTRPTAGTARPRSMVAGMRTPSATTTQVATWRTVPESCVSRTRRTQK